MSPIIKRGGDKFTLPSKYLLFILTILCVALIAITFNTSVFNGSVNTFAGTIVVPFQKGITTVGVWMKGTADNLASIRALQMENEELRNQVEQLTIDNTNLEQDKYELTKLRELYELDAQYSDYKKIGARIIAKDAGNWYHSFVIDKGSDEGIEVDMNVIADGGLVGRITDVGPDWAKVQTIIADSPFRNQVISNTLRETDWKRGNHYIYRKEDFSVLMESDMLFARKFSTDVDSEIIDMICESNCNVSTDSKLQHPH